MKYLGLAILLIGCLLVVTFIDNSIADAQTLTGKEYCIASCMSSCPDTMQEPWLNFCQSGCYWDCAVEYPSPTVTPRPYPAPEYDYGDPYPDPSVEPMIFEYPRWFKDIIKSLSLWL